ncbi:MAG: hypothetical protein DRR08_20745 [Candidatus Parabeggiatoa sp. nov. 2]|nr:MAG: hypothetical protein B6247_06930 [Beggiatoa sp. 4572_84]RKZ56801.1 MAG: hypothetical protein DRR08_20745 [Gammaproteobacteria bacterium]
MATGNLVRKKPIRITVKGIPPMRLENSGLNSGLNPKFVRKILATPPAQLKTLCSGSENNRNRLYFANNLPILAALLKASRVAGKVQIIYIEPPFSTQSIFHSKNLTYAYKETLSGYHFLEFLQGRLILLRQQLADTGSNYLHLDEKRVFFLSRIKVIMDEVFGEPNYNNCIVRKKCNKKNILENNTAISLITFFLHHTKSENYTWNRPMENYLKKKAAKEYQYTEPKTGRRYQKISLHAPGGVRQGQTGKGIMPPPPGKHWQNPPESLITDNCSLKKRKT